MPNLRSPFYRARTLSPGIQIQAQPGGLLRPIPFLPLEPDPGHRPISIPIRPIAPQLTKEKTWFQRNWMWFTGIAFIGLVAIPMIRRRRRGR